MRIPAAPGSLYLPVVRRWDGGASHPELAGCVRLAAAASGLELAARFPSRLEARRPAAPAGRRVADLWHYDVAECFLVGAKGGYLEVELGAGGHFLVLAFDGPRQLVDDHADLALAVDWRQDAHGWSSRVTLPWSLLPRPLAALNAFAIFGDAHLAFAPLPGGTPDFHQPDRYPAVELARAPDAAASTSARASSARSSMRSSSRS